MTWLLFFSQRGGDPRRPPHHQGIPDLHKDIVTLQIHRESDKLTKAAYSFAIELTTPACPVRRIISRSGKGRRVGVAGVQSVDMRRDRAGALRDGPRGPARRLVGSIPGRLSLPGIRNVIAVGASKGSIEQDDAGGEFRDRARPHRRAHRR